MSALCTRYRGGITSLHQMVELLFFNLLTVNGVRWLTNHGARISTVVSSRTDMQRVSVVVSCALAKILGQLFIHKIVTSI